MVEMRRRRQLRGHAGDAIHDVLAGAYAVEAAGVAAEPKYLPGAGEQGVIAVGDADGALLGAAVTAVEVGVGVRGELGVGARQQCLCGVQGLWGMKTSLRGLNCENVQAGPEG